MPEWWNWQTRMVQVHVPVEGVGVQLPSPALGAMIGVFKRGKEQILSGLIMILYKCYNTYPAFVAGYSS